MTNYEVLKSLSIEEMACFLESETTRIAKLVFDLCGYGIHPQIIYQRRLEWLKSEAENVDRCVVCGEVIPEGRQACPICEKLH